jgi:hypothetical protein
MGSDIHRVELNRASRPSNCHPEAPSHADASASLNLKNLDAARI